MLAVDGRVAPAGRAPTASTKAPGHAFPRDTAFISQPVWSSIGYTLPATLGAGLAEPLRRPVLVIGDGAAQIEHALSHYLGF